MHHAKKPMLVALLLAGCGINPAARDLVGQEQRETARLDFADMSRPRTQDYLRRQFKLWQQLLTYARQSRFSTVHLTEPQKQRIEGWARRIAHFVRQIEANDTTEAQERDMLRQIREHWHRVDGWLSQTATPEGP